MKLNNNIYYVKETKWDEFLQNSEELGFEIDKSAIYPQYIIRENNDGSFIKISISQPCVNMWDKEDKNKQREIWLQIGKCGYGLKCRTSPYIKDLVDKDYVE